MSDAWLSDHESRIRKLEARFVDRDADKPGSGLMLAMSQSDWNAFAWRLEEAERIASAALAEGLRQCEEERRNHDASSEYYRADLAKLSGIIADLRDDLRNVSRPTPPASVPVVEVVKRGERQHDITVGGRYVTFEEGEAVALEAAKNLRSALTALWPPQPAPSAAWEEAAKECLRLAAETIADDTTNGRFKGAHLEDIARHFRTLSAPGAGGVKRDGLGRTKDEEIAQLRHWLAGRDAEVARLRAEVETLKRDSSTINVEAAVATVEQEHLASLRQLCADMHRHRDELLKTIASMRPVVDAAVACADVHNDHSPYNCDMALYLEVRAYESARARSKPAGTECVVCSNGVVYRAGSLGLQPCPNCVLKPEARSKPAAGVTPDPRSTEADGPGFRWLCLDHGGEEWERISALLTTARAEARRDGLREAAGECKAQAEAFDERPERREVFREMQEHLIALASAAAAGTVTR